MITPKEKLVGLDPNFVETLTRIASRLPFTLVITSALRSKSENSVLKGAVADSSHLSGLAVDVRVADSSQVARIIDACEKEGVFRRGIYIDDNDSPIHIHFDVDMTKPRPCIFIKREQN